MRVLIAAIALLVLGSIIGSVVALLLGRSPLKVAQGDLRCEGAGAVIVKVDGKDYAVNGLASPRYPPLQCVWNSANYPDTDIGHITSLGLTLCDW
jgi:hypothetical protein